MPQVEVINQSAKFTAFMHVISLPTNSRSSWGYNLFKYFDAKNTTKVKNSLDGSTSRRKLEDVTKQHNP